MYIKNEDIPENKEILIYGFKHVITDKIGNYISIECESDELYENDKLFIFWSNNFVYKEIKKRVFKTTGWSFMTLVKRNNFFLNSGRKYVNEKKTKQFSKTSTSFYSSQLNVEKKFLIQ